MPELHALAGEAAMLGLDAVARGAREGEDAGRRWADGVAEARAGVEAALRALDAAIAAL